MGQCDAQDTTRAMEYEHLALIVRLLATAANLEQRDDDRVRTSTYGKLQWL